MKDRILQTVLAVLGGFFGFLFGNINGLMIALILFMSVDYTTGVMSGVVLKKLSSSTGFKGICKKVTILMLVAISHAIDLYLIGNGAVIMTAVECFYIANEGISILENACKIGLKVPPKLLEVLEQLKEDK